MVVVGEAIDLAVFVDYWKVDHFQGRWSDWITYKCDIE